MTPLRGHPNSKPYADGIWVTRYIRLGTITRSGAIHLSR